MGCDIWEVSFSSPNLLYRAFASDSFLSNGRQIYRLRPTNRLAYRLTHRTLTAILVVSKFNIHLVHEPCHCVSYYITHFRYSLYLSIMAYNEHITRIITAILISSHRSPTDGRHRDLVAYPMAIIFRV